MSKEELEQNLNTYKENVLRLKTLYEEKQKQLNIKTSEYNSIQGHITLLTSTSRLLEQCNITSREFVKVEVEKMVTQALRGIFEDSYIKFNINFVVKHNQTEAEFILSNENKKSKIKGDILATYGGGLGDIISVALRVIVMQLLKIKGPLILDEPGKFISEEYINNFGKFLVQLSNTFNRQIIMVTHNERLVCFANNTIKVSQVNRVSKIEVIDDTIKS